ncbi:hypothetical protein [Luteimicrobium sp. DT211]|uniref:hypothetical protein n=1 Tax=Luteimicrobium sp. DT211 TaxID=3393412 RepID=UPI003CF35A5A
MHRLTIRSRRAAAVAAFAAVVAAGVTAPAAASFAAPHVASSVTLAASTTAKPHITSNPKSVVVASGKKATFKVKASGAGLTYRWYVNTHGSWKTISKATHASHSVTARTSLNGHLYRVVVKNSHGKTTSHAARLTVAVTPRVTSQPRSTAVVTGKKASLAVHATGNALHFQWYAEAPGKSYAKVAHATSARYTFTTSAAKNGYRYKVAVSNKAGRVVSSSAKLTVITKPKITKQPVEGQQVPSGTRVTLAVKASGIGLTYQWQYADDSADGDGSYRSIKGATHPTYSFKASTTTHDDYRVVISNKAGKVASDDSLVLVDSSASDPYGVDGFALLNSWIVGLDTEAQGGTTTVTGDNPSIVKTTFFAYPGTHAATGDLSFTLLVGGQAYKGTPVVTKYEGGDYDFAATATVPVSAATAKTGVWKVTDSSGAKPVTQYFKQR